jgi:threonine dehydrogenase-like Zn-dependent dehydrogenase
MAQKAMAYKKVELASLITHRLSLEKLEEGLKLMNDPAQTDKIKTVITI